MIPFLAISTIRKRPVPKIIAFGGVATGSIKANDPEMVAGSISSNGLTSILMANPAKIGRKVSTVAVLDVTSVKNVIRIQTLRISRIGCTSFIYINCSPNQADNPDSLNPLASANPPPNSKMISQGMASAAFQSIKKLPGSVREGIRNNTTAINMATVPSLMSQVVRR